MRVTFRLAFPALAFTLAACIAPQSRTESAPRSQSAKPGKASDPAEAQRIAEETAIASAVAGLASRAGDYTLSSADLIEVTIYREEELARTIRVSQTGEISMPLIGTIQVGGISVQKAQALLAERYREYLVNPQVTLFIKEYGNKKVYVLGEVKNPGSFDVPPESKLTVLEAISLAGGFTPVAAKDRTRVIRAGEGGKSQSWNVEVTAIMTKGEKHRDLSLEPNDVIYVPQSFF